MSDYDQADQHSIGWLPWFFVREPVTIGNVTFRPFGPEYLLPDCDVTLQGRLLEVMKRFIQINGKPMPLLIIVLWQDDMTFPRLDQAQWDEMIQAVNLLALANFAINEHYTPAALGPHYVNSSMFQFFGQNYEAGSDHTVIVRRRRDNIPVSHLGWLRKEVKDQMPRAYLSCTPVKVPDGRFLEALRKVHECGRDVDRRIVNSLFYFMFANTDDNASTCAVEAVQLEWAIEHLIGPCGGREDFVKEVEGMVATHAPEGVSDSSRPKGKYSDEAVAEGWGIIQEWANEFYFLRNKITHGKDLTTYQWRWDVGEHCVFAAWLYPLLVKLLLVSNDDYVLTEDDQIALAGAGKLLAADSWRENWPRVLNDQGSSARRKALEKHSEGY